MIERLPALKPFFSMEGKLDIRDWDIVAIFLKTGNVHGFRSGWKPLDFWSWQVRVFWCVGGKFTPNNRGDVLVWYNDRCREYCEVPFFRYRSGTFRFGRSIFNTGLKQLQLDSMFYRQIYCWWFRYQILCTSSACRMAWQKRAGSFSIVQLHGINKKKFCQSMVE